jgi:hypothetical protein
MILHSTNGIIFELWIEGYEFPHYSKDNWLYICVDVTTPEFGWYGVDPCAETWHINALRQLLDDLGNYRPIKRTFLSSLDPGYMFEVIDEIADMVIFEVLLWHDFSYLSKYRHVRLELRVSRYECLKAVQSLADQMEIYSIRD